MGISQSVRISILLVLIIVTFQACQTSSEGGITNLGSSSNGLPSPTPAPGSGPTPTPIAIAPNDFTVIRQGGFNRDNAVLNCPSGTTVSGCTGLCSGAYGAGGAYPNNNGCVGSCDSSGDTVTLSTFCAKNVSGRSVTVQKNTSAVNGNVVSCPSGTQLLGCSALCANGRPGGTTVVNNNTGCQISCSTNETGGVVAAFCLQESGRTISRQNSNVANGSSLTCGSGTYLAGAAGFCNGPSAGGLTTTGQSVNVTCNTGTYANTTAFCIQ